MPGPAGPHADKLGLFGQFVGSWTLEWAGRDADGNPATMTGELHFGCVLGGRAVQDIWIVPGRGTGRGQAVAGLSRFDDPLLRRRDRHVAVGVEMDASDINIPAPAVVLQPIAIFQ